MLTVSPRQRINVDCIAKNLCRLCSQDNESVDCIAKTMRPLRLCSQDNESVQAV